MFIRSCYKDFLNLSKQWVGEFRIVVCGRLEMVLAQTAGNSWPKFLYEHLCCNSYNLMKKFGQKTLLILGLLLQILNYAGKLRIFKISIYYLKCSVWSLVFIHLRHIKRGHCLEMAVWPARKNSQIYIKFYHSVFKKW